MKQFLLIAALTLFVGAGCVATTPEAADDATPIVEEAMEIESGEAMEDTAEHEEENAEGDSMETSDDADEEADVVSDTINATEEKTTTAESTATETSETTQTADGTYKITDGTSTYIVKKEFFGKPKQDISGTTPNVSGSVSISKGTVSVDAIIQNTFSTGSGSRDGEVKKLLQGPITVQASSVTMTNTESLAAGKSFDERMNLELTIAGVTKSIPFHIVAIPNGDELSVTGNASFNMETDFGIKPPSVLNVYKVNPEMTVLFKLISSK